MKSTPRLCPKGRLQNTSLKQNREWTTAQRLQNTSLKQNRGLTTTQRNHARISVLCKQTHCDGSKQQQEVAPICSATIICTSIILPRLSLYLRRVWMIRNKYFVHTKTRRTRTKFPKCNIRLGVDMNTEPVLIMPDKVVHDATNQATKRSARLLVSLKTVQMQQHDHDPRVRPHCYTAGRQCSYSPKLFRRCHTAAAAFVLV